MKFHKQHVSVVLLKNKGVATLTNLLQQSGRVRKILEDELIVHSHVCVHRRVTWVSDAVDWFDIDGMLPKYEKGVPRHQ